MLHMCVYVFKLCLFISFLNVNKKRNINHCINYAIPNHSVIISMLSYQHNHMFMLFIL